MPKTMDEQARYRARISAQAYIDEFPAHDEIDAQWLRQTWELDAAQQRWFTSTWETYRCAAIAYFQREKALEHTAVPA